MHVLLIPNLLKFAGLLNASQRRHNRIEKVQQNQHAILVVVQLAIAGTISFAAIVVQTPQQRRKLVEEFEPGDIGLGNFLLWVLLRGHAQIVRQSSIERKPSYIVSIA